VILKTQKNLTHIFLVLVPHRDTRLVLRNYSADLFKAGFAGAYHFPWVAPLASLSRAFDDAELKHFSRALREIVGSKIHADKATFCAFDEDALFGPSIDIDDLSGALKEVAGKVTEIFARPVIGSCLLTSDAENAALPAPPQLSFRAAAAANMYWRRTDEGGACCVKWKIGKLFWLPSAKDKGKDNNC